jgi:hypothetical protein
MKKVLAYFAAALAGMSTHILAEMGSQAVGGLTLGDKFVLAVCAGLIAALLLHLPSPEDKS